MANRNRSVQPYNAAASNSGMMMPYGGDSMLNMMQKHHDEMNQMANRMFQGFGFDDPFKDDPFFNRKPFGGMDQMMKEMRNSMMTGMDGQVGNGQSRFQTMSYSNSTKIGPDGKPVSETYQTKTKGAVGPDGKRISERHQMYDNTATGHQKMAHERMLDGQGRKVVKQRLGNDHHEHDIYRNLKETEAPNFDNAWNRMAEQVGFAYQGNRLGYAEPSFGSHSHHDFRSGQPDDARRGQYLPLNARAQDAPVMRHKDIGPTQPMPIGARGSIQEQPRQQNPTLALPATNQRRQAAPVQAQPTYQAAPVAQKKAARAG